MTKVLITGARGFIGKNLYQSFLELDDVEISLFDRSNSYNDLQHLLKNVDFVFHLAGVNRSCNDSDFQDSNVNLTLALLKAINSEMKTSGKLIRIIFTSSIQAQDSATTYGQSKLDAENLLKAYADQHDIPLNIYQLPNIFGKWCKPNYNSVVATYCHNIARGKPINIKKRELPLELVHIDDVISSFKNILNAEECVLDSTLYLSITPSFDTTLGELADLIHEFHRSRQTLLTDAVGTGFIRALYSTYVSYLPLESFSYTVPTYIDERGSFTEVLKTQNSGQFSFFTAYPGITRGGHYHHTKTEKFLVIKGQALFRFRHIQTFETHEILTSGRSSRIVETVPGWTHDITNVGSEELIVMLWANEIFDRALPDTYSSPL